MSLTLQQLKQIKDAIESAASDPDVDVRQRAQMIQQRLARQPNVSNIINAVGSGTKQQKLDGLDFLFELLRRSAIKVEF